MLILHSCVVKLPFLLCCLIFEIVEQFSLHAAVELVDSHVTQWIVGLLFWNIAFFSL